MFLHELVDEGLSFAFKLGQGINLVHYVQNEIEIMSVVDSFLLCGCLENQHPHFFVIVAELVKFWGQIEKHSLMVNNFVFPLVYDNFLILSVQTIDDVAPVQLSVVSETLEETYNLLNVEIVSLFLHQGFPEV